MSNQELQIKDKTTEDVGVEKRRQFIKGASIVAPVILTLASPSVFGIQCASEICSGNQSHSPAGSCTAGRSIAVLGDPNNAGTWPSGYSYGTKSTLRLPTIDKDSATLRSIRVTKAAYSGGTKFKDVFGGIDNTTLREYLVSGSNTNPSLQACLSAALLNAANSKSYPLTVAQVKAIQAGTPGSLPTKPRQVPDPIDVIAYLKSTW
ncbi:MAG: hypothetical protein WCS87_07650 [Methylococcaceae bacterium]